MKKNYTALIALGCFGFGAVVDLIGSFVRYAEVKTRKDTNDMVNMIFRRYDEIHAERDLRNSIDELNDLIRKYKDSKEETTE